MKKKLKIFLKNNFCQYILENNFPKNKLENFFKKIISNRFLENFSNNLWIISWKIFQTNFGKKSLEIIKKKTEKFSL